MRADVLTTWGVVLELDRTVDAGRPESASRLFAQGRHAFFERCPRLASFLLAEKAVLRVTAQEVGTIAAAPRAGGLMVGVSVVEVRPLSFDMAVRIRLAGEDADQPTNGRCTIVIERGATGERIPIPRDVRDEFISLQLSARKLC